MFDSGVGVDGGILAGWEERGGGKNGELGVGVGGVYSIYSRGATLFKVVCKKVVSVDGLSYFTNTEVV